MRMPLELWLNSKYSLISQHEMVMMTLASSVSGILRQCYIGVGIVNASLHVLSHSHFISFMCIY
jgi:hypothetical protein